MLLKFTQRYLSHSPTASEVKHLRTLTGSGFKHCIDALKESEGDVTKAIELLVVKGVASAEKRGGREASKGLVGFS